MHWYLEAKTEVERDEKNKVSLVKTLLNLSNLPQKMLVCRR